MKLLIITIARLKNCSSSSSSPPSPKPAPPTSFFSSPSSHSPSILPLQHLFLLLFLSRPPCSFPPTSLFPSYSFPLSPSPPLSPSSTSPPPPSPSLSVCLSLAFLLQISSSFYLNRSILASGIYRYSISPILEAICPS